MSTEAEQRLYGIPGAERMHFEPESVYEDIDSDMDEEGRGPSTPKVEIEEWSVHPPRHHMPSVGLLLDWLIEWTAENGEYGDDFGGDSIIKDEEARAAAEVFLDAIATKVTWRQADNHLRSLWVSWDEAGEPLLDGEPMYRPAGTEPRGRSGVRGG